ncbi:MAG: DUF1540 domain-containing protein [Oligoflexia bacterium]|nr:DUF1540 domain-containing protein [Oligoflexia bacterium]
MPPVARCSVTKCTYNVEQKCHAKAITVGDSRNPGCDTYFSAGAHSKSVQNNAGVGACKVSICRYNDDFECVARSIEVGIAPDNAVKCLSFSSRTP